MNFNAMRISGWKRRNGQGSPGEAGRCVTGRRGRRSTRASRLSVEVLEDRIALTTFLVVNSLDGQRPGSLRFAITQAEQSGSGTNRVVITSQS